MRAAPRARSAQASRSATPHGPTGQQHDVPVGHQRRAIRTGSSRSTTFVRGAARVHSACAPTGSIRSLRPRRSPAGCASGRSPSASPSGACLPPTTFTYQPGFPVSMNRHQWSGAGSLERVGRQRFRRFRWRRSSRLLVLRGQSADGADCARRGPFAEARAWATLTSSIRRYAGSSSPTTSTAMACPISSMPMAPKSSFA